MEDDALLFHDYETVVETWKSMSVMQGQSLTAAEGGSIRVGGEVILAQLQEQLATLRDENEGLKEALAVLVTNCIPEELQAEAAMDLVAPEGEAARPSTSQQKEKQAPATLPASAGKTDAKSVDSSYFDSYSQFGIHREMISDAVSTWLLDCCICSISPHPWMQARTEAYRKALEQNPSLIKGKKVIDVGCGTGILSLFACRAGASHVFSIEGSERMATFARDVCKKNGFDSQGGGPMTVLTSKVEDIKTLPSPNEDSMADVLVSEWMGYALLFETMLDSVLFARDHLLKPQGAVLPDLAHIVIAGAGPKSTESSFWRDVYGFDMSPIADEVAKSEVGKALVHAVDAADLVTESVRVKTLDLVTMRAEDQDFSADFTLTSSSSVSSLCSSIVIWFDTEFSSRFCKETPVVLSTSVASQTTHWVQTVLVLDEPVPLMGNGKEGCSPGTRAAPCINGRISMVRDPRKHRSLDISLEYKAELSDGTVVQKVTIYNMSVKD